MFIFGFAFVLVGCKALGEKWDEFQDVTNGFVAGGYYWGVEEMDELSETSFAENGEIMIYLANANVSANLSANPASRGTVLLSSNSVSNMDIPEGVHGEYSSSAEQGLSYYQGEFISLDISHSDIDHEIGINAPYSPNFSLDDTYPSGVPLTVDLVGQGFQDAIVAVIYMDAELTPEVTYDSTPSSINEMYELGHPDGGDLEDSELQVVEIPVEAFPYGGNYLVGIAGIQAASKDDMVNMNTAMSSLVAGKFRFQPMCVLGEEEDSFCVDLD